MFGYSLKPENDLSLAVIKLVIFFDLFDYPLTPYEIYINLDRVVDLSEIIKILQLNQEKSLLEEDKGFYFLLRRREIVQTRERRYNYSCYKLKIAHRWSLIFKLCPFVRLVALSNSFGEHNFREGGDLDFFIVSSRDRIWLSRLYCTGLAKLLNRRPTYKIKKNRICLSFYVSENHLNLDDLKIADFDPHFHYWRRYFFLLFDKDGLYSEFLRVNANKSFSLSTNNINCQSKFKSNNIFVYVFDWLELISKKFQVKVLPLAIREAIKKPGHVIINDEVLKFHENDSRQNILEKYGKKIYEILKTSY